MRFLFYITLFLPTIASAQHGVKLLLEELPSDSIPATSLLDHSSIQPAVRWSALQNEALLKLGSKSQKPLFGVDPLLDANAMSASGLSFRTGGGIQLESAFKRPWYIRVNAVGGIGSNDTIFASRAWIVDRDTADNYSYVDLTGRIAYTPNKVFSFQTGLDHNFIGEGSRSLFLSDYGKPYPFAQLAARFWRIEYTTLYQFMHEGDLQNYTSKFGATHHVSFNAAKWLNFGIFETVIFQPKDTALQRGFDLEYLNPVIFYRPQEYAVGSSDNVLIGASMTLKIKEHTAYFQFIVDEFSLTEIKARSGWWANKFGGQAGIKGRFSIAGWKAFYRTEYNFLRPYTYAHLTAGQNYGNLGFSLAHPYGANMMEILGELKLQKDEWLIKLFASYFLLGLDKDGYSYGADVYRPYTQRPFEYDHHIGQGRGNNGIRVVASASYQLMKNGQTTVFTEQHLRYDSAFDRWTYLPVIGIRSAFRNDHRNY
jgi:hypothetical protein